MTTEYPTDTRPAPAAAIEMASEARQKYSVCFWFEPSGTPIEVIADVRY